MCGVFVWLVVIHSRPDYSSGMNNIIEIIIIVGPLFLLMGFGALLRFFVRKEKLWFRAEQLAKNILLPILIIFILSDINRIDQHQWGMVQLIIAASIAAGVLMGIVARLRGANNEAISASIQSVMQHNIFIACAGVLLGLGFDGMESAVIAAAIWIPLLNILNIGLERFAGRGVDFKAAFKKAIVNPPVLSCLFGFLMMFEGFDLPELLEDAFKTTAKAALPLGVILAGTSLIGPKLPLPWKSALPASAVKAILLPALAAIMAPMFGVVGSGSLIVAVFLFAVTPVSFTLYTGGVNDDPTLRLATLRLQAVGFVLTLPFWLELTNNLP